MRNAVIARDSAARAAAEAAIEAGGTALDAALAGLLAGATRASAATLLGAGGILLAGTGVGAHFIDGRARAPGLGEKRPRTPEAPPATWTAAVPGLLEAVLAAHLRFGTLALTTVVRLAMSAVREEGTDAPLRARIKLVERLRRTGLSALEDMGVLQGILQTAGPVVGGVFTKEDLVPVAAPVIALASCTNGTDEVLVPPRGVPWRGPNVPPELPLAPVESVLTADKNGVMCAASWVVAPEAAPVEGVAGLSLASLVPVPKKAVTRWRPGGALPSPIPLAIVLTQGRAWGAMALAGKGPLVAARDAIVSARLAQGGVDVSLGDRVGVPPLSPDAVVLWAVREDEGDDVRATMTAP